MRATMNMAFKVTMGLQGWTMDTGGSGDNTIEQWGMGNGKLRLIPIENEN